MPDSITIHSTDENGNSYQITMTKAGKDSGAIEIKKLNPPPQDHPINVSNVRANQAGTKLVCTANVIFSPTVNCVIDDSDKTAPIVQIDVNSIVSVHEKYEITPADFDALTNFVVKAAFPPLA